MLGGFHGKQLLEIRDGGPSLCIRDSVCDNFCEKWQPKNPICLGEMIFWVMIKGSCNSEGLDKPGFSTQILVGAYFFADLGWGVVGFPSKAHMPTRWARFTS